MDLLLHPNKRIPKVTLLDHDVIIDAGPRLFDKGNENAGFTLVIPKGVPAAFVGSLDHKELIKDVVLSKTKPDELRDKFVAKGLTSDEAERIVEGFGKALNEVMKNPLKAVDVITKYHAFIER